MGNMSYCRFENTYNDLKDCYEAMSEGTDKLSDIEKKYFERLIKLSKDIAEDYSEEDENDE